MSFSFQKLNPVRSGKLFTDGNFESCSNHFSPESHLFFSDNDNLQVMYYLNFLRLCCTVLFLVSETKSKDKKRKWQKNMSKSIPQRIHYRGFLFLTVRKSNGIFLVQLLVSWTNFFFLYIMCSSGACEWKDWLCECRFCQPQTGNEIPSTPGAAFTFDSHIPMWAPPIRKTMKSIIKHL